MRGVRVEWAAPDDVVVVGDREALKRAAANLVTNAVRVAPAGSIVHVRAGRVPGWCWFGVRDAGPGIDPADQPHVFARAWHDGRSLPRGGGPRHRSRGRAPGRRGPWRDGERGVAAG